MHSFCKSVLKSVLLGEGAAAAGVDRVGLVCGFKWTRCFCFGTNALSLCIITTIVIATALCIVISHCHCSHLLKYYYHLMSSLGLPYLPEEPLMSTQGSCWFVTAEMSFPTGSWVPFLSLKHSGGGHPLFHANLNRQAKTFG